MWEKAVEKDQEIIDSTFIQYFLDFSKDELATLLDNYKGQFHFKTRRLMLMNGKVKSIEVGTHQIARNVQWMHKHSKSHSDDQTETRGQPKLGGEEIISLDSDKHKGDTNSLLVIFVDDIHDTIDLSGNIIEPDKHPPIITVSQVNAVDIPTTQSSVDIPPPPVKYQQVKSQLPSVSQANQEEPTKKVEEKPSEQEKKQEEEKIEEIRFAKLEKALVKQQNDDDDDSLGIKGPIDVENMSVS